MEEHDDLVFDNGYLCLQPNCEHCDEPWLVIREETRQKELPAPKAGLAEKASLPVDRGKEDVSEALAHGSVGGDLGNWGEVE